MDRLKHALTLLGYQTDQAPHHRSNLIHAILAFAAMRGDTELERACDAELQSIKAASAA